MGVDLLVIAALAAFLVSDGASRGRAHVYGSAGVRGGVRAVRGDLRKSLAGALRKRKAELRKTRAGRWLLRLVGVATWLARIPWKFGSGFAGGVRDARTNGTYTARREAAAARRARAAGWLRGPQDEDQQPPQGDDPQPAGPHVADPQPPQEGDPQPAGPQEKGPQPAGPQPEESTVTVIGEVTSIEAFLSGWKTLQEDASRLVEDGASLGLTGPALAPGSDVIDALGSAVEAMTSMLAPLVEAASTAPAGVEDVKVRAFRTE